MQWVKMTTWRPKTVEDLRVEQENSRIMTNVNQSDYLGLVASNRLHYT